MLTILSQLNEESLYKILKNKNNAVVNSKRLDFLAYGIELTFTDEAFRRIAKESAMQKTGARALLGIVEHYLLPFEKALPSFNARKLILNNEAMDAPDKAIALCRVETICAEFSDKFFEETSVELIFSREFCNYLCENYDINELKQILEKKFKNYNYGLKILQVESFEINEKMFLNPEEELAEKIREYEVNIMQKDKLKEDTDHAE